MEDESLRLCASLAANPLAVLKHLNKSESEPSLEEKITQMHGLLLRNPVAFLQRWGSLLSGDQLRAIHFVSTETDIQLKLLEHEKSAARNKRNIRNRRFEKMQELLKEGTYFSDEEMKKRSPYLFHHYVGQFITEREAQRLARDSEKSSWSEQLLSHMDHQVLRKRMEEERLQYQRLHGSAEDDEENDEEDEEEQEEQEEQEVEEDDQEQEGGGADDEDDMRQQDGLPAQDGLMAQDNGAQEMEQEATPSLEQQAQPDPVAPQSCDGQSRADRAAWRRSAQAAEEEGVSEREWLHHMLQQAMCERFLRGEDAEFIDYAAIDACVALDNMALVTRDEEERYFDADDEDDTPSQPAMARARERSVSSASAAAVADGIAGAAKMDADDEVDDYMNFDLSTL